MIALNIASRLVCVLPHSWALRIIDRLTVRAARQVDRWWEGL